MPDFWRHSGFHLTEPAPDGGRLVTDDLLRAFCARPELEPVESSCDRERALFASLIDDPRRPVGESDVAALGDPDARDNYRILLNFRDRLVAAGTIEAAYAGLFVDDGGRSIDFASLGVPPLFADQLAHIAVRGAIDGCEDPFVARAAELFFREQRASVEDGRVLLADLETVEKTAQGDDGRFGNLGRLVQQAQTPLRRVELDILSRDNAHVYWARDERHDTVLAMHRGQPGLDAFCRVVERWVATFFASEVEVVPLRTVERVRMAWYTGLDRESTRILNDLYNGREVEESEQSRLLALLEMRFAEPALSVEGSRGGTCHLALAMDGERVVRMKPQNLITNLPFKRSA